MTKFQYEEGKTELSGRSVHTLIRVYPCRIYRGMPALRPKSDGSTLSAPSPTANPPSVQSARKEFSLELVGRGSVGTRGCAGLGQRAMPMNAESLTWDQEGLLFVAFCDDDEGLNRTEPEPFSSYSVCLRSLAQPGSVS